MSGEFDRSADTMIAEFETWQTRPTMGTKMFRERYQKRTTDLGRFSFTFPTDSIVVLEKIGQNYIEIFLGVHHTPEVDACLLVDWRRAKVTGTFRKNCIISV